MSDYLSASGRRFLGDGMGGFRAFFHDDLLPRFGNAQLARQSDSALIPVKQGRYAITCDSFIVDPLVFPGGDIGKLSFCGVANDLLTECARPEALLMSLMVTEELDTGVFDGILDSLSEVCRAAGAKIVGGDTKTLPGGGPQMIISMSGFGYVQRIGPPLGFDHVNPGDAIVLTGAVGAHSIAVLSSREGLGFESVVRSDCQDVGATILPMVCFSPHLSALRDATRGGVLGVLHDLASTRNHDVRIDLAAVPVEHEVLMACELLGLDPLELVNEGCMVLFVKPVGVATIVDTLRSEYAFSHACVIGVVSKSDGADGRVLLRQGGQTVVAPQSVGAGIPRLC